jgi:hypothetical protein
MTKPCPNRDRPTVDTPAPKPESPIPATLCQRVAVDERQPICPDTGFNLNELPGYGGNTGRV